jgi:predicted amidohydrolase
VRSSVWKALLVARAIENQCYVIGVNRVGENPDGTTYTGDSAIIGP